MYAEGLVTLSYFLLLLATWDFFQMVKNLSTAKDNALLEQCGVI